MPTTGASTDITNILSNESLGGLSTVFRDLLLWWPWRADL